MDGVHGGLGEDQLLGPQDVIDVQAGVRQDVDVRDVAGGQAEVRIDFRSGDDQGLGPAQLAEGLAKRGRLGLLERGLIQDDQVA